MHVETPLIESMSLSASAGAQIFLKLDAVQPTGSFKARGVGYACVEHRKRGAQRFISSSGGNAGLAVAYSGRRLGVPVTVVVPKTTTQRAKRLIELEQAEVIVHGESWHEANAMALTLLDASSAFIHPFDDPLLWTGHATLVDELARQTEPPDAIVLSVGGGGLLCGVGEGLKRNGWNEVAIVAVETLGADSYAQALAAGKPVLLPAITSIASSLGARQVCQQAVDLAREFQIESVVVSDAQAVAGCMTLLDEHRILAEPACGASLAALTQKTSVLARAKRVVVVVCGGVGVNQRQLLDWDAAFRLKT
ncbi:pyridoxal-phosphate dependent enzyme [Steroidobacter sp.]|uniref:pyridoxal-phosphate dependent enzyme n=1 Tax=Steroidobacter sp. TaxID=1978227 RepID=UPI001A3BED87|nr:pyridoxal-phosphate dependent enzyme [Steroidobacter sp.]MBL8268720.1 pyridoxal-phosphate dependent enzyme [Steroidobacter sp.]